jgi:hypothetical protein
LDHREFLDFFFPFYKEQFIIKNEYDSIDVLSSGGQIMKFYNLPKRKADVISNGVFLVLLGFLFYTGQWWPGILFAIGLTFAIRQYFTGRRLNFFITLVVIGFLGLVMLAGHSYSLVFPLIFIGGGIFLILKEFLNLKTPSMGDWPSDSQKDNDKK